jgi:hypothetical protein
LGKGVNLVNRGVLAVKGNITTKNDSRILFVPRVPYVDPPEPETFPDDPYYDEGIALLEEDLPYTPRFFHVPGGDPLLDAGFITGFPYSPRGPVEDSLYMKAPEPFPDDPDSDLVKAIWAFLEGGKFPLPVHMLDFFADQVENDIKLTWMTASETNNDRFNIWRSYDGHQYHSIGEVDGQGTIAEPVEYSFTDHDPRPGMLYYKLIQTDFDGSSAMYGPLAIWLEGRQDNIKVYPNPTDGDQPLISLTGMEAGGDAIVRITDISGKTIWMDRLPSAQWSSGICQLDLNRKLNPGVYFVNCHQGMKRQHTKLLVE